MRGLRAEFALDRITRKGKGVTCQENEGEHSMPTYKKIQEWVKGEFKYTPKTCWIAHVKSEYGLTTRQAYNRISPTSRAEPCPESKREDIKKAFRHLKMI